MLEHLSGLIEYAKGHGIWKAMRKHVYLLLLSICRGKVYHHTYAEVYLQKSSTKAY